MSLGAALRRMGHATGTLDATRPYITMFDDITIPSMPSGGSYAYAGYVDGIWPTFPELKAKYPRHRLLSVAVFASDDAECLDIEKGDAPIEDAPEWYERQVHRGVWRPALYTSASNLRAVQNIMTAAHIARASYRLWSAHYLNRAHICAPKSCGYGISEADGCQWTSRALGINLDQSILLPDFFDPRPAPTPQPDPKWQETMMNKLPTIEQGAKDGAIAIVARMQALVQVVGHNNGLPKSSAQHTTGVFDDMTKAALIEVQNHFKIKADGVCGPKTWPALVTGQP